MLHSIYKILPMCIVKVLALQYCEVLTVNGKQYVQPFDGVLIAK